MHQGYGSTTSSTKKKKQIVQKQLKIIYYNSSLDTTESEFPFNSVLQSKGTLVTENVVKKDNVYNNNKDNIHTKDLKDNTTLCKEKLQGKFKKCRDFLKDVPIPSQGKNNSEVNSSGVLKEVVLENVGKRSKSKLLKCMQDMGLTMKEAAGNNETLIVVDLSPLNEDKKAFNHFMTFVEKLKEKRCERTKKQIVSKKKTLERNLSKTIESLIKRKLNVHKEENLSTLIDKVRYFSGQSLCINNIDYEDEIPTISIASSDRTVKNIDIYQSTDSKNESKQKLNQRNKIKNSRNSVLQNLFRSTSPTAAKVTSLSRQNKMHKRSKLIKMLNILRMLFFYKKDTMKNDDNKTDDSFNSYMAYPLIRQIGNIDGGSNAPSMYVDNEQTCKPKQKESNGDDVSINPSLVTKFHPNNQRKRESTSVKKNTNKQFGISPSLVIVDGIKDNESGFGEGRSIIGAGKGRRHSVVDEPPATVWGRRISPESRKELELIAQRQQNPNSSAGHDKDITTKILDQNYELHRILNQQIAIKDMIEKIQNSLDRNQSCDPPMPIESTSSSFICDRHRNAIVNGPRASRHQQIRCTNSAPTNRATVSSSDEYCCHHYSFNDSMTDIPNRLCWCPDFTERLRLLFGMPRSRTSRLEINMQCELEQQRREIIRLNKLLRRHILENRSS